MKQFDALLEVADKLLSPGGCPWDRKQNFYSLQPYVLEEAHEVIEAVDSKDDKKIIEELGDLLYTVIFYGKLAELEGRFSLKEILEVIKEKLIRRHPHIFGDVKVEDADEVLRNWEAIKRQESGHEKRKSAVDGVPPTLPTLAKTQKVLRKMKKAHPQFLSQAPKSAARDSEEVIGETLLDLIAQAEETGVDAESALRRTLARYEGLFRKWEETK